MTTEAITTGTTEGAPQRPENIPEKFWNAETGAVNTEALLASYTELEKKQSAPPTPEQPVTPQAPEAPPTVSNKAAYEAAVAKATEELAQSDAVSDETYAALEAAGVSRAQVDTYIAGQRAATELRTLQVTSAVGGEDNYKALIEWAVAGNYTAEEAQTFNSAVFGADKAAALAAVATLKNRYDTAMGTDARMVMGESANKLAGGYATKSEWLADISKKEYKTDPSFRAEVERKLSIAIKNKVDLGVKVSRS